eukprot:2010281-Rhodomonas_salina.3
MTMKCGGSQDAPLTDLSSARGTGHGAVHHQGAQVNSAAPYPSATPCPVLGSVLPMPTRYSCRRSYLLPLCYALFGTDVVYGPTRGEYVVKADGLMGGKGVKVSGLHLVCYLPTCALYNARYQRTVGARVCGTEGVYGAIVLQNTQYKRGVWCCGVCSTEGVYDATGFAVQRCLWCSGERGTEKAYGGARRAWQRGLRLRKRCSIRASRM